MYLQVEKRKIHYLDHTGTDSSEYVIVLIHGLGQNLWTWEPLIPYLSDYRIIRYDLAGHGASSIPTKGIYQMHTFTDELYNLLSYLDVHQVTLYGYELGACIAMNFANLYPEFVARIVTVAHPVYYPDNIRQKKFEQYLNEIRNNGLQAFVKEYLPNLTVRHDYKVLAEAYMSVSMNTYEAVIQILKTSDLSEIHKRNYLPVLHLVGDMDNQYPPDLMFNAMQYYPASILVQIPYAKNLVHIDNPDYTAQRVDAFIKANTSRSSPLAKEASMYYASLIQKRNEQASDDYHLRVDVIHRFEARINGRLLVGNWKIRKAQELLIYLLCNRRVSREKLYDLFWPHLNLENAQNMLRVSINHLKKIIDKTYGTSFINSKREFIELRGTVESDLIDLLNEIKTFHASRNDNDKELIARKIGQAVTPDILDGYYNDWIMNMRDELLNAAAPIIKWIANRYEAQDRLLDSILYYKLMLKMLPEEIELIQKIANLYDKLQLKGLAREWHKRYSQELYGEE